MSSIETIQRDVTAKLLGEPYFADLSVFAIREQQVESQMFQALQGVGTGAGKKAGITISVLMPELAVSKPNAPGPACTVNLTIRVMERPDINKFTGDGLYRTGEDVALQVAQEIHRFQLAGICGPLYPRSTFLRQDRNFLPALTYDVLFDALLPLQGVNRLAAPTITPSSGSASQTVTLAGPPGAAIYYTLDGSFPNTSATLYTAPFAPAAAQLRCAAYLAGFSGSDINLANYTLP